MNRIAVGDVSTDVESRFTAVAVSLLVLAANGCGRSVPARSGKASPDRCAPSGVVSTEPADELFIPPTHRDNGAVVMPVAFPDGSTAELVYPPSIDIASLGVTVADMWGRLTGEEGSDREVWITYGPVDSANVSGGQPIQCYRGAHGQVEVWCSGRGWRSVVPELMYVPLGDWTARIKDGYMGDYLTERQRRRWASNLALDETGAGWPVLRESADTELGAEHWGHVELMLGNLSPGILLFPVECDEAEGISGAHDDWFASLCFPEAPMRVHVYGGKDEDFVRAVAGELRVRNVRLTFPADQYQIAP